MVLKIRSNDNWPEAGHKIGPKMIKWGMQEKQPPARVAAIDQH